MKLKLVIVSLIIPFLCLAQKPAAETPDNFLHLLKGKNVGLTANHTTLSGEKHLLDVLLENDVNVKKIYAPEHGFRGNAGAGEEFGNTKDEKTGILIVSIYGGNKKPTPAQLKDIDYMVFDMQDVGTRFYTYLSTMHYIMEACAENNIPLVVLDRPNPNGFYVDGPILDTAKYKSFIGMHPIPIVHGMTLGELAQMINGEVWLAGKRKCNLTVVPCTDYTHNSRYKLPVKPSPSLPNMQSIYLYPSLCLFEGSPMSIARGTDFPFSAFGHPSFKGKKEYQFSFVPTSSDGKIKPILEGKTCYGIDLRNVDTDKFIGNQIELDMLVESYKNYSDKNNYFKKIFYLLCGTDRIKKMIVEGKNSEEIRATWKDEVNQFKKLRKKYLIYPDFE